MSGYPQISAEDINNRYQYDDYLIVDTRPTSSYYSSHIISSINCPPPLDINHLSNLQLISLYCKSILLFLYKSCIYCRVSKAFHPRRNNKLFYIHLHQL